MVKVVSSTTFSPDMVSAFGFFLHVLVGALHVVVAGDRGEEVAAGLAVGSVGGVVPGVDEVLRLDLGAVVELVRLELDREDLVVARSRSTRRCRSRARRSRCCTRTSFDVMASMMSPPQVSLVLPGISGFSGVQPATVISPPVWPPSSVPGLVSSAAATTRRRQQGDRGDAGSETLREFFLA